MNKIKKLPNSMQEVFTIICCSGIALFLNSCNNDATSTIIDCGCDSETLFSIPNEELQMPIEEQISGLLFYKHPEDIDDFYNYNEYNNKFWIFQGAEGCSNCHRQFIICNENLLGTKFEYLKQDNVHDSIEVKFTGKSKRTCKGPIVLPSDYSYNEILLTSIQQK